MLSPVPFADENRKVLMTIGIKIGNTWTEIGSGSFLHAFFSTISQHLEPNGWGSRFPILIKELYHGRLSSKKAKTALVELQTAKKELKRFGPDQVIWDIENLDARPPWDDNISPHITDLSNYFVTSTGRDLFDVFEEVLALSAKSGKDIEIQ